MIIFLEVYLMKYLNVDVNLFFKYVGIEGCLVFYNVNIIVIV